MTNCIQKIPCKVEMEVLGPDDTNQRLVGITLIETSYPIPIWIGSGPPPEEIEGTILWKCPTDDLLDDSLEKITLHGIVYRVKRNE